MNTKTILLAATLCLATDLAAPAQTQPVATPGQQAKTFEEKITVPAKLEYLLSLPTDYGKSRKAWPLVLFLHGSGESGNDLNKVKVHGPPKLVETNGPFPFILVSPQSPGRGWDPAVLNALLDSVIKEYHVDKDRVYLTGLSMGGYGTWTLAAAHPEKFAALAPICGGGNPADAGKLAKLDAKADPTLTLKAREGKSSSPPGRLSGAATIECPTPQICASAGFEALGLPLLD